VRSHIHTNHISLFIARKFNIKIVESNIFTPRITIILCDKTISIKLPINPLKPSGHYMYQSATTVKTRVQAVTPDNGGADVRFEVIMAVTMKNAVFCDVELCSGCSHLLTLVPRSRIFLT
jgi:hypothetical protein